MIDAYAIFLLVVAVAFTRIATSGKDVSIWQRGYGLRVRAIALTLSLTILLLGFTSAVDTYTQSEHAATTVGTLLWASLIAGSLLYSIGAASWTGRRAFSARAIGWLLLAAACAFPSTLTIGLPLVGLLACALVPISSRAPEGFLVQRAGLDAENSGLQS
jgi:peptidoglycan/LPS O-acetylase OafA/YrhL